MALVMLCQNGKAVKTPVAAEITSNRKVQLRRVYHHNLTRGNSLRLAVTKGT